MSSRLDQYRSGVFGNNENIQSNSNLRNSQLGDYLQSQRLARAKLSRRDLQDHTDVKFFISPVFASFVSFMSVLVVTFCVGYMGWGREEVKGSYWDISKKYETLLTPIFWIIPVTWLVVFVAEAVYIVASFLNQFGHLQIVQTGVGFNFFFINCCQLGWIVSYCCDYIWLAFIFMAVNTCLLLWLNFNLYYQGHINKTPRFDDEHLTLPQSRPTLTENETGEPIAVIYEFLLFRLPFQLHLGWVTCVLLLNLNEMAMALKWNSPSNIAIISIVILWIVGLFVLFYPKYPIFIIPVIISWYAAGVWVNLRDPSDTILKFFEGTTLSRVYGGIIATCIEHAIITVIRFVYYFANSYNIMEKERT